MICYHIECIYSIYILVWSGEPITVIRGMSRGERLGPKDQEGHINMVHQAAAVRVYGVIRRRPGC